MDEIKVGEYIRTKDGQIGIFQNIDEHCRYYGERLEDTIYIINTEEDVYLRLTDDDIKVHSKMPIELVEVGDYVNGHKVTGTKSKIKNALEVEAQAFRGNYFIDYNDIKTILTHEMYEQNCYKIGE